MEPLGLIYSSPYDAPDSPRVSRPAVGATDATVNEGLRERRSFKVPLITGLITCLLCIIVSLVLVLAIRSADRSSVERDFEQDALPAASDFQERLVAYTMYQVQVVAVYEEHIQMDPGQWTALCRGFIQQFSGRSAVTGMAVVTGVAQSARADFEASLRTYWTTAPPDAAAQSEENGLFIKSLAPPLPNTTTWRLVPAPSAPVHYAYTSSCDPAQTTPPSSRIHFFDVWMQPEYRLWMFLCIQANKPAVGDYGAFDLGVGSGLLAFMPVNSPPDVKSPWFTSALDAEGFPDAVVLGMYDVNSIVEEVLSTLPAGKFVVLVEDVNQVPDFLLGGEQVIDTLRDMKDAIDAFNLTLAEWHLKERVMPLKNGESATLLEALYPCERKFASSFQRIPQRFDRLHTPEVCVARHDLDFGKGTFISALQATTGESSAVSSGEPTTAEASSGVRFVSLAQQTALQQLYESRHGPLSLVQSFRVSFANRQLNVVIAGTDEYEDSEKLQQHAIIVITACVLSSCLIVALAVAGAACYEARKTTSRVQRRTLIADASRLANEQATKYAVHELETPLLAMTERSRATQEALDDVTASLYEYIAARTGVDVASVHHILMTSEPFNVLEHLLDLGGAGDISHEDRLELQALLTDISDDLRCAHDDISQVHLSCQAMSRLISDLLDLASLRKGEFKLNAERTSLRRMMAALVNQHRGMAVVPLRLEPLPRALPTYIMIDPLRFAQVLSNGLTNACKLTREGSIYVAVRVEWPDEVEGSRAFGVVGQCDEDGNVTRPGSHFSEGSYSPIATSTSHRMLLADYLEEYSTSDSNETEPVLLTITVSDTGPGLEGVDAEKLFQPFEQGPAQAGETGDAGEAEQRGTGLGLPLARRMARAMGGDLELRNRTTRRGSLYVASLPALAISNLLGTATRPMAAETSRSHGGKHEGRSAFIDRTSGPASVE